MNFLFITKGYPPIPDQSGMIVYNLKKELQANGNKVDVIARNDKAVIEKNENGNIYWIQYSLWEKINNRVKGKEVSRLEKILYLSITYLRKLLLAFKIRYFPDSEPSVTKKIVHVFNQTLVQNEYDCIVAFFRPYSCLAAALEICRRYPSIQLISCYFDLVEDGDCPKLMPVKLYKRLIKKGDKEVFENSNYVMLPTSAQKINDQLFQENTNKIIYYEFPTFVEINNDINTDIYKSNDDCEIFRLVFAGTMNRNFRNPQKMLELLNEVAKCFQEKKFLLELFGGGDCQDIIRNFKSTDNFVINYHGLVPRAEVLKAEKMADFLINIMNTYVSIVPSKIFGLFATGKPILNIMTNKDDGSLKYFDSYPICQTVSWDSEKMFSLMIQRTYLFIKDNYNVRADINDIRAVYKACTPKYVANQILEAINRKNDK